MYLKIKAKKLIQVYYIIIRMLNNMEYPNSFQNPQPKTRLNPQHIVNGIITIKDKLNNPNTITLED
jgi:hypothetical protein